MTHTQHTHTHTHNKQVGLLIAGAKERGELENRVTKLLAETRDDGDVILMCAAAAVTRCVCVVRVRVSVALSSPLACAFLNGPQHAGPAQRSS